jgi:hypothetical protein
MTFSIQSSQSATSLVMFRGEPSVAPVSVDLDSMKQLVPDAVKNLNVGLPAATCARALG